MKFTDEEMDEAWERVQEMKRKKKGRVFGIDTETAALLVARLGRGKPANSDEDVQPTSNKIVKKENRFVSRITKLCSSTLKNPRLILRQRRTRQACRIERKILPCHQKKNNCERLLQCRRL